ncbi:MAG: ribosome maturation factor RimP [Hyphomicrobiales bacterium]
MSEIRLRSEQGVARRVADIVEPAIEGLGYRVVKIRITGQNGQTLQIMAERPDGSMDIAGCEEISRAISPLLDVEDPISGKYQLEISSPGIDRPLVRPSDFEAWSGFEVKLEMAAMIAGRKRFRGKLEGFEDGEVRLWFSEGEGAEPVVIGLPFDGLAEAKLVMNDELLKAAGAAEKQEK